LSKSRDEIHKIWEKNMHDFVPEDMLLYEIIIESNLKTLEKNINKNAKKLNGNLH
jgi:hypothetical protein